MQREGLHMRTSVRRLSAVALTTAVAAGSTLVAAPAPAATNRYAATATTWLNAQLTKGLVHNDQFDIDDFGLSLDEYFAMKTLGRPRIADSILNAVGARADEYIQFNGDFSAGATAKLATAVELDRRNPRSFGGFNLVR